jgi:hypothetical protein
MKHIKMYARFLEILGFVLAAFPIIGLLIKWFGPTFPYGRKAAFYATVTFAGPSSFLGKIAQIPATHRLLGFLVDGISVALIFFGIITFVRIMRCLRQGDIFSRKTVFLFRRLSILALLWAVYTPVRNTLLTLVESLHNPAGQRIIAFTFGSDDVVNIFILGFFLVITSVMQEASALKEEQELTV